MQLERLKDLANFLSTRCTVDEAVRFISLNACLSGCPCRLFIARLNNNLTLQPYASLGYSEDFLLRNATFNLISNPLLKETVLSDTVTIVNRDSEYFKQVRSILKQDVIEDDWRSTVFIPLLPSFAAALTFQVEVENNSENKIYLEALGSLINLYLQFTDGANETSRRKISESKEIRIGMKLTERQEVILDMVKAGMTNPAIAEQLGYSESLIRQETMAIYQKLGVDGRRSLVSED